MEWRSDGNDGQKMRSGTYVWLAIILNLLYSLSLIIDFHSPFQDGYALVNMHLIHWFCFVIFLTCSSWFVHVRLILSQLSQKMLVTNFPLPFSGYVRRSSMDHLRRTRWRSMDWKYEYSSRWQQNAVSSQQWKNQAFKYDTYGFRG